MRKRYKKFEPTMKGDHQRTSQVRVGVRVRPLASKEIQQGGKVSLTINLPASITIAPHNTFTYDAVFDSQTDQDGLYSSISTSLLASFVEGYNATVRDYFGGFLEEEIVDLTTESKTHSTLEILCFAKDTCLWTNRIG